MEGKEEGECDGEEGEFTLLKVHTLCKGGGRITPYMYSLDGKYLPVRFNEYMSVQFITHCTHHSVHTLPSSPAPHHSQSTQERCHQERW